MARFSGMQYCKTDLIATKGIVFVKYARSSSACLAMETIQETGMVRRCCAAAAAAACWGEVEMGGLRSGAWHEECLLLMSIGGFVRDRGSKACQLDWMSRLAP